MRQRIHPKACESSLDIKNHTSPPPFFEKLYTGFAESYGHLNGFVF